MSPASVVISRLLLRLGIAVVVNLSTHFLAIDRDISVHRHSPVSAALVARACVRRCLVPGSLVQRSSHLCACCRLLNGR